MSVQAQTVQRGERIDYTPAAAVAAGDIVYLGKVPAVASYDIAANVQGAVAVCGVYDIVKDSNAINLGAPVYWDSTNKKATATAKADFLGIAVAAATASETVVRVLLNRGTSEYSAAE